ncbi:MAG: XRE family transcriptional regulator [Pseudaminobacter sp.]
MPITPVQCRAARRLAKIDRTTLAAVAGVDVAAIRAFESEAGNPDRGLAVRLQHALESLGVDFLPEESGRGVGIRLKFDRAGTRQISRWESEGGAAADDDVP